MSIEQGLLRAIIEEPDDDTHRLVYADWLEEQGNPRADFIRVQIALSKMDEWDERRPALLEREGELLRAHRSEWAAGLEAEGVREYQFERGFVASVTLPLPLFLAEGDTLLSLAPLTGVSLMRNTGPIRMLVNFPWLRRLRRLNLTGWGWEMRDGGLWSSPRKVDTELRGR